MICLGRVQFKRLKKIAHILYLSLATIPKIFSNHANLIVIVITNSSITYYHLRYLCAQGNKRVYTFLTLLKISMTKEIIAYANIINWNFI